MNISPGRCFKIIKTHVSVDQFPRLVAGAEFEVLENSSGGLGIKSLVMLDDLEEVTSSGSQYWCLYESTDVKEIEEIYIDPNFKRTRVGYITMDHFQGKEVKISSALFALSSQENCDSEEHDLMYKAAEYIVHLENKK